MTRFILILHLLLTFGFSQLVITDPPYATRLDTFSVVFDASLGNGGLAGYLGDDIYAHTGVTIEGVGTWQYVNAQWEDDFPHRKLDRIEGDLWRLNIGDPYEYYGVPTSLVITQLSFVFKNSSETVTGRDIGAADIFLDLYEPGISVAIQQPVINNSYGDSRRSPVFMNPGETLNIFSVGVAIGTQVSSLELFADGENLISVDNDSLEYSYYPYMTYGIKQLKIVATDTAGVQDSTEFAVMVVPLVQDEPRPADIEDGINYLNDSTVVLSLFAPYKEHVFIIGDFNDWMVNENYFMKRDMSAPANVYWWLEINGLTPGQEYALQYLVDGAIRIADPYSEKILHQDDSNILPQTYPDLKPYPGTYTDYAVSVIHPGEQPYDWQVTDFQAPPSRDLVIYELLIRDFIATHDFNTLIDTLDYLQNLGINAIELMPVSEFENNESWGYNPSFHLALDKYYGPKNDFKRFVDECHSRGIAVILDVVYNHAFGQSPLVRLYASGAYGPPDAQNPWLNITARHDFNVGYDFNHESPHTQYFLDKANSYWLQEYNIDGYRFDLTKGFMQTGSFYDYNAGRIALLKRMVDEIREIKEDTYIIFEHLGANDEETELANYGIMLWGKMTDPYNEATMGYHDSDKSNLSWGYYVNRGWSGPNLITYMESHDEERLMFKNITYGNSSGNYSVQNLSTALQRIKAAAAFFFTVPGPKMIWQFGEVGYDFSIDYNGRVGNKPIRWDYFQNEDRRKLYNTFAALIKMRNENSVFRTPESISLSVGGALKRINLENDSLKVTIIGNFGVTAAQINPNFQEDVDSLWYDFFSGDTISVTDVSGLINLQPGEFHIYTNNKINSPLVDPVTGIKPKLNSAPMSFELFQNYPNPFNPQTSISYQLAVSSTVTLKVFDVTGREVSNLVNRQRQAAGKYLLKFDAGNLASGIYFYVLKTDLSVHSAKMLLIR